MAIPENKLETWSRQGAAASASALYERIRNALQNDAVPAPRNFDAFLQGSYRNSTNIRGDSDVDVVVRLNDTYMPESGTSPVRGSGASPPRTTAEPASLA